jgi:competence ComEA-like helix-hairpin-helix protein
LVLVLVALVIATAAPLSRVLAEIRERVGNIEQPPVLSWTDHQWHWSKDGSQGEGLYPQPGRKSMAEPVALPSAAIDPHLAIFTYRPIDLNRADAEVLQTVKGIGPKLAGAIVGYRLSNGPFRRRDDLLLVKGVGPAKFANLCDRLTVVAEEPR